MSVGIRLTRELYERALADLRRPHPFAFERVGFVTAHLGNAGGEYKLVLVTEYYSIPDDQYVEDPTCGARINSEAIRDAMQRVLDLNAGSFHVHLHEHSGKPGFGQTDQEEIPRIIEGLRIVGPEQIQGMLLFSADRAAAQVWLLSESEPLKAAKITVVGYPLAFLEGESI
jgi:hypothetical protein